MDDQSALKIKQSKQFAYNNANMPFPYATQDTWLKMERYNSSDAYNDYIRYIAYNEYPIYTGSDIERSEYLQQNLLPESIYWNWQTDDNRGAYRKYRNDSARFTDYAKAVTGAIMANHILSAINAYRIANTAKKATRTRKLNIYTNVDYELTPSVNFELQF